MAEPITKPDLQPGEIERYGYTVTGLDSGETVDVGTVTIAVTVPTSASVFPTPLDLTGVSTVVVGRRSSSGGQVGSEQVIGVASRYDQALVQLLDSSSATDITSTALVAGSESHTTTSVSARFTAPLQISGQSSDGFDMKITFSFETNAGREREAEFIVPIRSK